MSHDAQEYSSVGLEPVIIEPGSEDDLPAIVWMERRFPRHRNGSR